MKKLFTCILLLTAVMMSAQEVPASFPRKYLIEHFTGDQCGYCPGGMFSIEEYISTAETPCIWVSHHYGYNEDEYTIPENAKIGKACGVSGAPNMAMNRTKIMGTSIAFHPGYLVEAGIPAQIASKCPTEAEASVVINHTYDAATRELNVTVSGQVANTDVTEYLLTVLIKENGLIGKQSDYNEYSFKSAGFKEFVHPRVVRDVLCSDALGDIVAVENQAYSQDYTFTLPEGWVAENCGIVAYITPTAKKPIINAEETPLVVGTTGGEEYLPFGITQNQAPSSPDKLTFDSVVINKPADDKLELILFSSKSVRSSAYGAMKSMVVLEFNTTEDVLPVDTFDIQEGNVLNTLTAGYAMLDSRTFAGSCFHYIDSKELAKGNIVIYHTWRLKTGKLAYGADGSLLVAGNFANGKHFTMTAENVIMPTNPCVDATPLLEPTAELALNINNAFDVYRIDYQAWLNSGVNLVWSGNEALHTFVAKDCEFAVAIHHKDVVNYTEVPAAGNVVLNADILTGLASYVDADGYLYIRFLTEAEGILTIGQ
jgi:hypothetical protein